MADANERIILEVDTSAMTKAVEEATAKLIVMKNSLAILDDAMKKGNISVEDYARKSSALKAEIQATQQEQSKQTKMLTEVVKHNQAAAGSVDALKAELAVLTAQYNALSQEERENSAIGKELTRQTKEVSDKLKEAGKAIGDTRREVGNYREQIEQALLGNTQFAEGLSIMREGFSTLKSAFADFGQGIKDKFAEVDKGIDGTNKGIAGAHKAAIGFGIGLKAIGIGFIVAAIAGLVNYFTQTREGADKIGQAFAYLGGVVTELSKRSAAFGKAIYDAVTQPMKQIERLGNFLKLAFTDPQEAIAQLKKNVNNMVVDMDELSRAAHKTAMAMVEIEKANQRLERDRIENIATSKELIRQEEALKNIRDNEFNSVDKRISANEKVASVEQKRLKTMEGLAQRRVDILKQEAELLGGIEKLSNPKLQELREAELELADIQEESLGRQNEIITNRFQLHKEKREKEEAEEKAAMERRLARQRMEIQLEIERAQEGSVERLNAEIKMLAFERDQKQKEFEKGSVGYELAQVEFQNKSIKLSQEFTQKQLEEQKKRADEFIALTNKEYSEAQKATEDYYQRKQTAAANDYAEGLISREQFNEKLQEIEGERLNQQIQVAKDYSQSTTDLEAQAAERRIAIRQSEADKKKAIQQAEFATAQAMAGAFTELANLMAGQGEELTDFQKAAALFQIGIDTAASLSSLTLTSAKVSGAVATASGPFGVVTGPLAYAAYYGTGLTTILSAIGRAKELLSGDAPKAPSFQDGGILNGPSHANGGIPLFSRGQQIAEVEGGEAIINRNSTSKYKELLSAINVAGGGKPLSLNRFMAAGGISAAPAPVFPLLRQSQIPTAKDIAIAISKLPPPVLDVRDSLNAQERRNNTQRKASIK